MPKLQRAKTVACGLLRWDRCCIIVVSHWSKPAGQNMASLLVVVGFRTSHSMPKEESHVIFSKNLPLKGIPLPPGLEIVILALPTLINTHNSHLRVLYSEDLAPVDHAVPRTVHRCWSDRTSLDPGHLWGAMIAEGQADCSGERRGRRGSS